MNRGQLVVPGIDDTLTGSARRLKQNFTQLSRTQGYTQWSEIEKERAFCPAEREGLSVGVDGASIKLFESLPTVGSYGPNEKRFGRIPRGRGITEPAPDRPPLRGKHFN